jgi:hypothetical protein
MKPVVYNLRSTTPYSYIFTSFPQNPFIHPERVRDTRTRRHSGIIIRVPNRREEREFGKRKLGSNAIPYLKGGNLGEALQKSINGRTN